jgi:hypothetical protein
MEKELILKSTITKDRFIINGCGKFSESRKSLTRAEASYLYLELHKWLFPEKE